MTIFVIKPQAHITYQKKILCKIIFTIKSFTEFLNYYTNKKTKCLLYLCETINFNSFISYYFFFTPHRCSHHPANKKYDYKNLSKHSFQTVNKNLFKRIFKYLMSHPNNCPFIFILFSGNGFHSQFLHNLIILLFFF